jgi:tetratricopeptide (TPR) repeat protein
MMQRFCLPFASLPYARNRLALLAIALCVVASAFAQTPPSTGGGILVFGRVYLPDGKPASRVKVFLETSSGLLRDTICDDNGNYDFRSLPGGRYRVKATNPDAPEQFSDPAESDSTRSYANRVQIHVYLRLPLANQKQNLNPGTIDAAEASVPTAARKAYEQGLKFQKENQADKALPQFQQAIELYPGYFQALTARGNLFLQRNRLIEAATDFDRAMKLNEKYAPALRGMGVCMLQTQHPIEAVELLLRSSEIEPDEALTQMFLGFAQMSVEQPRLAEESLRKALKLDAVRAVRAHAYLADLYARENKFAEAANELRQYLAAQPNAADAAKLKTMEAEWRAKAAKK